jgi:hypothetical protein
VRAALPALTVRQRQALLGMLNGRSHQQLADEHGGTAKAFALALRRARDKLAAVEAPSAEQPRRAPGRQVTPTRPRAQRERPGAACLAIR